MGSINSLYDFFTKYCEQYSEKKLFLKENITYGQALKLAKERAAFIQTQGYQPGDVIAILSVNSAAWVITYMALSFCGIYALLLDTNLNEEIYKEMLGIVKAKALFVSNEFGAMNFNLTTFNIGLDHHLGKVADYQQPKLTKDTIASLSFTSGTTGNAKVVPLSHYNVWRTSEATAQRWGEPYYNKVVYGILPIYHVYGMVCSATGAFVAGSGIVFQTSLKATEILKDLQEYKVNVLPAVPRIWENFLDRIMKRFQEEKPFKTALLKFCVEHGHQLKKIGFAMLLKHLFQPIHDLFGSNHSFFVSGGAALKKEYQQAYLNMGFNMAPGYGLTETVGPIVVSNTTIRKLGSVGKPTEGNQMEIRNANAEGVGEVWLRGDSVFAGYYENEEATRSVFDERGWFNSGDLGFIDREGDLHLCGRKKNVIVLNSGKNVYPEDIVAHYKKSPLISELSVFGREMNGKELVYAVIVPEQKDKEAYLRISDVVRKLGHGLPTYKRIGGFAISYDVLPKTSTQKIKDHEVKKNLEKGLYQTAIDDPNFVVKELIGATPEAESILTILRELLNVNILYVNQKLEDFEIDSLDYIELISELEKRLKLNINTEIFLTSRNMHDLLGYLTSLFTARETESASDYLINSIVRTPLTFIYNPLLELGYCLVRIFARVFWRVKIINPERLAPQNAILVANHQSYLDPVWLFSFIPSRYRRDVYIAIKKEYSYLKYLLPGFNFIFVDREGNNFIPILKAEADILRQGKSLIVFPEGTRTTTGKVGPFRTGAAFLAKNLNKQLLPLTMNGSFGIWPRTKSWPKLFSMKPSTITVHETMAPDKFATIEDLNTALAKVVTTDNLK